MARDDDIAEILARRWERLRDDPLAELLQSAARIVEHELRELRRGRRELELLGREPETSWYLVLRVAPDATLDEIEEAFRKQSRKRHPDVGGSHEQFLELQAAYEAAKRARGET